MKIENFEDTEAWKESRKLVKNIYQLTKNDKFAKDFGLKDQIQRSAVSVFTNINPIK
jgi:four helix bundle protein